jgi:glycosyltransferase involved in cell wall biosynthesis
MSEPAFSVVVAAYNAERTLRQTITSVLNQTRPDFELVVVDDGSSDRTAELTERFEDPRVRLVRQANGGTAAARNTGISNSRAPLIALLDSDDLWLPSYLETMGAVLESDEGAALAYTDAWVLDDTSGRVSRTSAAASANPPERPPDDPRKLLKLLLRGNFVFTSTTFRREVIEEAGGFDGRCDQCEDYELWLRLAARGRRFARTPEPLAVYRNRPGSKSSDDLRLLAGVREMLELVLAEYELDAELRADVVSRKAEIDRELSGRLPRIRRRLRGYAKRLLKPYRWHRTPPREVAAVLATSR